MSRSVQEYPEHNLEQGVYLRTNRYHTTYYIGLTKNLTARYGDSEHDGYNGEGIIAFVPIADESRLRPIERLAITRVGNRLPAGMLTNVRGNPNRPRRLATVHGPAEQELPKDFEWSDCSRLGQMDDVATYFFEIVKTGLVMMALDTPPTPHDVPKVTNVAIQLSFLLRSGAAAGIYSLMGPAGDDNDRGRSPALNKVQPDILSSALRTVGSAAAGYGGEPSRPRHTD